MLLTKNDVLVKEVHTLHTIVVVNNKRPIVEGEEPGRSWGAAREPG